MFAVACLVDMSGPDWDPSSTLKMAEKSATVVSILFVGAARGGAKGLVILL